MRCVWGRILGNKAFNQQPPLPPYCSYTWETFVVIHLIYLKYVSCKDVSDYIMESMLVEPSL